MELEEVGQMARAGEEATVPPGIPHRWWNDSDDEEAHVTVELRPALNSVSSLLAGLVRRMSKI